MLHLKQLLKLNAIWQGDILTSSKPPEKVFARGQRKVWAITTGCSEPLSASITGPVSVCLIAVAAGWKKPPIYGLVSHAALEVFVSLAWNIPGESFVMIYRNLAHNINFPEPVGISTGIQVRQGLWSKAFWI